jgi:membrane associated rhomboid family serine protease
VIFKIDLPFDYQALILRGFSMPGFLGHILLHGGLLHLIGNMIFLWVFGNAICTNIGNWVYLGAFLFCTVVAAFVHVLMDGHPAIGASGAINGIVGMVFAMYPLNRVYLFWLIFFRGGSVSCRAWVIIMAWFVFDVWGALARSEGVAYWAHVGGFLGGVFFGLVALHMGWVELTQYDNRSLLDIIAGEENEKAPKIDRSRPYL